MQLQDARAQEALKQAEQALERAYSPYSRFKMGAAVVTDRGAVVPGALVENVSLGLAMCSERVAYWCNIHTVLVASTLRIKARVKIRMRGLKIAQGDLGWQVDVNGPF